MKAQLLNESIDFEFDAEAACQAMQEEMNWQLSEWERERTEEMRG